MAECIHEIEEAACTDCTPRHVHLAPARGSHPPGPWLPARYDGRCAGECGSRIEEGDMICADGDGHWLCEDCGRDLRELAPDHPGLSMWPE